MNICPLCDSSETQFFVRQKSYSRDFYQCQQCFLIFVTRAHILDNDEEKKRYDLHENHIRSKGYENFLRRLIDPLVKLCPKDAAGLDFGEGPYPMLREIMQEEGYDSLIGYDPYYNQQDLTGQHFDFITCSEVIEHVRDPKAIWEQLMNLLMKPGYLALSTGIYDHKFDFLGWQYTHDDTHINFFTEKTVLWLENRFDLARISSSKDLFIFLKK